MRRAIAFFIAACAATAALLVVTPPSTAQGNLSASGDITSVNAGSGLTGGSARGSATLAIDTTYTQRRVSGSCTAGNAIRVIAEDGTVTCESAGAGAGDIEGVTAGSGLTGGGTSGTVTVNVAVGTGLSVAADAVNLNLAGASCSAGSYVSALSSTGTGTCTAELGDITGVGVGTGLSGGGSSGAVAVSLNLAGASCAAGQYVSAIGSTGTGTCSTVSALAGATQAATSTTGNLDNYTINSDTTTLTVATSGSTTFRGFTGGTEGRVLYVTSLGPSLVSFTTENAGSSAANRIVLPTSDGWSLATNGGISFQYISSRWRPIGHVGVNLPTISTAGTGSIGTTLTVGNHAVVTNNVDAGGQLIIDGNSTLGDSTADSTAVSGPLTVGTTLGVTGTSTLSQVSANSITTVDDVDVGGSLSVVSTSTLAAVNATNIVGSGTLDVTGAVAFAGNTTLGNATTDTTRINGKLYASGTVPTLTCGSGPVITGNSVAGTISPGTGNGGSCTVTFAGTWSTNPPSCVATSKIGDVTITAQSTSAFTMVITDNSSENTLNYHCIGIL